MEDSLNKRYIVKLVSSAVSGIVNASILALVPSALGPVAFGNFTYLTQFFTKVLAFLDAGTSTALFTRLSAKKNNQQLLVFYFILSLIIFLCVNLSVFCINLLDISHYFGESVSLSEIYLAAILCFSIWLSQIFIKISDAYALTASIEIGKILTRIATLLFLILAIKLSLINSVSYYLFNLFSTIFLISIFLFILVKNGVITKSTLTTSPNLSLHIGAFKTFCKPLLQFNIIGIFVGIFDVWLLQNVSGSVEMGFYGLSYSIAALSVIFTSAMTPVISRDFTKYYNEGLKEKTVQLFESYTPLLYFLSLIIGSYLLFSSSDIIAIFSDERYADAKYCLMIMALYPMHQTYGQLTSSILFTLEETEAYKNIGMVFSLIGMILSLVFVYTFELGAAGLALKMVLTQVVSVNVQLWYVCKRLDMSFYRFIYHQIRSSISVILIAGLISYMSFVNSGYLLVDFITNGLIYSITILFVIMVLPKLFFIDLRLVDSFKDKLKVI
ncbi:lipopolysaccharide biosynthesis protein [Vibrio sinaloensis]|uniref:lipopolysaccharide biosynthesis protein n=1 Tax=Photobacterium sp. (strain ATCC 43367) TaxID=379097 RepID=UPI0035F0C393